MLTEMRRVDRWSWAAHGSASVEFDDGDIAGDDRCTTDVRDDEVKTM